MARPEYSVDEVVEQINRALSRTAVRTPSRHPLRGDRIYRTGSEELEEIEKDRIPRLEDLAPIGPTGTGTYIAGAEPSWQEAMMAKWPAGLGVEYYGKGMMGGGGGGPGAVQRPTAIPRGANQPSSSDPLQGREFKQSDVQAQRNFRDWRDRLGQVEEAPAANWNYLQGRGYGPAAQKQTAEREALAKRAREAKGYEEMYRFMMDQIGGVIPFKDLPSLKYFIDQFTKLPRK